MIPTKSAEVRPGEIGLSVIEALVVVAITSLLTALLLPLMSRASQRNYGYTQSTLDAGQTVRAETAFRAMLANLVPPNVATRAEQALALIEGDAAAFTGAFAAGAPSFCAPAGAYGLVRMRIERRGAGGGLICQTGRGVYDVLTWRQGEAAFAYSADGAAWRALWPAAARTGSANTPGAPEFSPAPLVRFRLSSRQAGALEWIARAGWSEPVAARVNNDTPEIADHISDLAP